MKQKKITAYDAGYSMESVIKRTAIAASAVALLGGLTACRHSLMGDVEYNPNDYAGNMVVEAVSDSDSTSVSLSDASCTLDNPCSSEDEMVTLDGDVAYIPD